MQERNSFSFGTDPRRRIDETNARGAAALNRGVEIVDSKADVVNAGASLLDKLGDWRVFDVRFQ